MILLFRQNVCSTNETSNTKYCSDLPSFAAATKPKTHATAVATTRFNESIMVNGICKLKIEPSRIADFGHYGYAHIYGAHTQFTPQQPHFSRRTYRYILGSSGSRSSIGITIITNSFIHSLIAIVTMLVDCCNILFNFGELYLPVPCSPLLSF